MNKPNLILFLLNIAGAAALLIWAVRLVRTGVVRGFSNLLRNWLTQSTNNRILSAFFGMSAAIFHKVLQQLQFSFQTFSQRVN